MQLVHGGDWAGYRAEFGRDALDFSANVSPLGLPEGVARAITAALPTADRYPDPLCRELRAKLALHEGVPAEQILCGNGAADLIFRLVWAKKPRRALVTAPTFAEYATALESVGCTVERFFLREQEDFAVTDAFCAAIRPGVDMVFLCQPNNPTGQLTALPLMEQILHRCAACGTLLVVDECFLDFLPDHALHTAKGLLEEGNLVIHTGETGKLVYGNGDPESENYNSLADFIFFDGGAEIRIPWNLLNFSDPSRKHIHDDYYENYGVEKLKIDSLFIGVGTPDGEGEIKMNQYDLKEWGNSLKYRERLKKSYYMLSQYWKE